MKKLWQRTRNTSWNHRWLLPGRESIILIHVSMSLLIQRSFNQLPTKSFVLADLPSHLCLSSFLPPVSKSFIAYLWTTYSLTYWYRGQVISRCLKCCQKLSNENVRFQFGQRFSSPAKLRHEFSLCEQTGCLTCRTYVSLFCNWIFRGVWKVDRMDILVA